MLSCFQKNKLHEIKLLSDYNKIIKNEFYNWTVFKQHKKVGKITLMKESQFLFFNTWGFSKWASKICIWLMGRRDWKHT